MRSSHLAPTHNNRPYDAESIEVESDRPLPPNHARTATTVSLSSSGEFREIRTALRRPENITRQSTMTDLINIHESHPTALERIDTHRRLHLDTVGSHVGHKDATRGLPSFGAGKPYPPALPEREEYVVEFDGPQDPLHAQNWPSRKKYSMSQPAPYIVTY